MFVDGPVRGPGDGGVGEREHSVTIGVVSLAHLDVRAPHYSRDSNDTDKRSYSYAFIIMDTERFKHTNIYNDIMNKLI